MRSIRTSIALIVSVLIALGSIMIYSASGVYASQHLHDSLFFFKRHVLFLAIGFALAFITMLIDYRELRKFAKPAMLMTIALLVLVLVPGIGRTVSGARRWFKIGFFSVQPAEFAKLTILIYTADFMSRKQNSIRQFWNGFVPIICVMSLTSLLVVLQPDLGNSVMIAVIVLMVIYIGGARFAHIASLGLMMLPGIYVLIMRVPWRLARIMTFIDPWKDSQGVGFQLTQSQIALGSGGLFGVGLGHSMQKLFYLPAAHTDFILSIIGEELGFFGAIIVVLLFGSFVWQGARIAKRTTDSFGFFLSLGIVLMIGLQAVINIGVSIGALPTKGLPLPFVSYGGSALIVNMIAVALLLNISRIHDLT